MVPETSTKCSLLNSVVVRLTGIGLILLSGICMACYAASKHLLVDVPTGMFTTYSGLLNVVVALPLVGFKDVSMFQFEQKLLVYLQAVFASAAIVARTWSIKNMKFGDAMCIFRTTPFFSILMARVILGHKVNKVQMFCCAMSAVGIILVSEPEFLFHTSSETISDTSNYSAYGPLVACLGALLTASAVTAQKFICDNSVDPIIIVVYMQCVNIVAGVIYSIVAGESMKILECYDARMIMVVGGVLTLLGRYLSMVAMSMESLATIGLVKNFDLVFCYATQVLFFSESVDFLSMSGVGCILVSVLLVSGSRYYQNYSTDTQEPEDTTPLVNSKEDEKNMVISENNGKLWFPK